MNDLWLTCEVKGCGQEAVGVQFSSNHNYYLYCATGGHPQAMNRVARADGDGTAWAKSFDNWRATTHGVFDSIQQCAETECNGDYAKAWSICYSRFRWS